MACLISSSTIARTLCECIRRERASRPRIMNPIDTGALEFNLSHSTGKLVVSLARSLSPRSTHGMADLGYVINHAMFQRNGRSGYVLKPLALRSHDKTLLNKRTGHNLVITVRHPSPLLCFSGTVTTCACPGDLSPAASVAKGRAWPRDHR